MSTSIDIMPGETLLAKELRQIAEILEARDVSAEMINMTLAARAGLPVAPVDPKSPIFVWVDDGEEGETPSSEKRFDGNDGHDQVTPGEFIHIVKRDLLNHTSAESVEASFALSLNRQGKLNKKQKINLHLLFRQPKASK